jgi:hypothetical protein
VERCPGHAKITGDLRGRLAAFDRADSVSNPAGGDPAGPATDKGEHVLGEPPKPVQGGDDGSISFDHGIESAVELGS